MSDGIGYGVPGQVPVGWLGSAVPPGEKAHQPLIKVAAKLAYYMNAALYDKIIDSRTTTLDQLPTDKFHRHVQERGLHSCEFAGCGMFVSGVFGFQKWVFPTGIVHYILDHSWQPPQAFLDDLAQLPEPPLEFKVEAMVAPNKARLFHKQRP